VLNFVVRVSDIYFSELYHQEASAIAGDFNPFDIMCAAKNKGINATTLDE
jgi:hypothetical protein